MKSHHANISNIKIKRKEPHECLCVRESGSPVAQGHLASDDLSIESQFSGEAGRHILRLVGARRGAQYLSLIHI